MQGANTHRAGRIALGAFVVLVPFAAGALAATGELTPQGCIDDQAPEGPDACTGSVGGLDFTISVAVSPDGKSVYAAGSGDSAVVAFERTTNGALAPLGCIESTGGSECDQETDGLGGPEYLTVSPDGKSVYVAAFSDDAIVHFKRNRKTGALTFQGCVEDTGQDECDQETAGLDGPESIAVSPDGKSVYAVSGSDDAIIRFKRDAASGALTPKDCVEDTGQDECDEEAAGLDLLRSVAVSPDGESVYAASAGDDAITRFKRNTTSGALTSKGCVEDTGQDECDEEVAGLDFVVSIAISPDGEFVYAASGSDDAIAVFERSNNGALIPKGCIEDTGHTGCDEQAAGLDSARSVAVSADGRSVYVASDSDDALVSFKRSRSTGSLTPQGCIEDAGQDECAVETAGLDGVFSVAVSPDGKSVYTAAIEDDAIVRFKREG